MGSEGRVKLPTEPQGFTITCLKSAWSEKKDGGCCRRRFFGGALWVVELNKKLSSVTPDDPKEIPQALDNLREFSAYESPLIENRGTGLGDTSFTITGALSTTWLVSE